jgi:hypothetical protein
VRSVAVANLNASDKTMLFETFDFSSQNHCVLLEILPVFASQINASPNKLFLKVFHRSIKKFTMPHFSEQYFFEYDHDSCDPQNVKLVELSR